MTTPRPRVPTWRRRILLCGWVVAAGVLVARAAELQVLQGSDWRAAALDQHQTSAPVAAARGDILDRDGAALAVSRETYRVAVAPRELRDRDEAQALLQRVLGVSAREARALTDPSDAWRVVPGRYEPSVREALSAVRGLHLERELRRDYPHGEAALGLLGRVRDHQGVGGIEEHFDSFLRGTPGRQVVARDHVGRPIPGEVVVVEPPSPGGDVRLTIDLDLQEIAHEALASAVASTGARGGDILVTDPGTGEILAMVSLKDGRADALSVINAPYEPGSTLKPFTVAGILVHGVGRLGDLIDTEKGRWRVGGHVLSDISDHGTVTLAEGLRVSSNVAIAKAARNLTPGMHYETLRDFGFGAPTGVPLPGEVGGILRRPSSWSARSAASLAIGYEVAVTSLQMAMAYGALANGGELMEPRLVRETRSGGGRVLESLHPRVVRRVVPAFVSHSLSRVLVDVVEGGTGTAARMTTFSVAGKSGTSRAYVPGVGYTRGRYFSSFAGFFPADDPQLVIFVKLDSPKGPYYGGATAAPVTRATMEAVLAARQGPLDRGALLKVVRNPLPTGPSAPAVGSPAAPSVGFASTTIDGLPAAGATRSAPRMMGSSEPLVSAAGSEILIGVPVPDVRGLSSRAAARRLHALGFRVIWRGDGGVVTGAPAPGTRLPRGDTVRIDTGGPGSGRAGR